MAISPHGFPPRKRRPSAGAFIPPNLPDLKLVQSLLFLARDISVLKPLQFVLRRSSSSIIRLSRVLSILFEEILRHPICFLPYSAVLSFTEMYIVLQRVKTLLEDCSNGSKMWLLMQSASFANSFNAITMELSTLVDIFPAQEFDLNEEVKEIIVLLRKQCCKRNDLVEPRDENLRNDVLELLNEIKRETVPDYSNLAQIFDKLGLVDSKSCMDEIDCLEEEIQNQACEQWKAEALIGLVRYGKCVLFGASTPRSDCSSTSPATETNVPADFRCPITLELMRDPVVVSTGQTYDRSSISHWIDSGHNTCPKTGQTLTHTNLIPNRALKNLIALWCREHKLAFESPETKSKMKDVNRHKPALEATRMTASFLVNRLSVSLSTETAIRVVHELRTLAKIGSDSRACIVEAGAIPLLVRYLSSDNPRLQVNAVTTILNLSILEANKTRIMEAKGAMDGLIEVLRSGATWEAKGNAAATVFSLSTVYPHRKRLIKRRVIEGLVELARGGPSCCKRDSLVAIMSLAGDRETVGRLIEGGVVEMAVEIMDELPEEAVTVLAAVAKRGGAVAVAAAYSAVRKLGVVLRDGTDMARESAAATLVSVCPRGGTELVVELAMIPGIDRAIWRVIETGTMRGRRKAAILLRLIGKLAAGMEGHRRQRMVGYSTNVGTSRTVLGI